VANLRPAFACLTGSDGFVIGSPVSADVRGGNFLRKPANRSARKSLCESLANGDQGTSIAPST